MRNWQLIIIIVLTVIIQVSLLPFLHFGHAIPNLIMIAILIALILGQDVVALWWITLGGVLLELYSPFPFGVYIIQFILLYILFRFFIRPLLHEPSPLITGLTIFIISLVFNSLQIIILRLPLSIVLIYLALYEAILGAIIYYFSLRRQLKNAPIKIK